MSEANGSKGWRQQAKDLGIPLFHRKKENVLKEIGSRTVDGDGVVINGNVADVEGIEPIDEPEKYKDGAEILWRDLMGRIETLENRVNRLIVALDKSKSVRNI